MEDHAGRHLAPGNAKTPGGLRASDQSDEIEFAFAESIR